MVLAIAGCSGLAPHPRSGSAHPGERLAALLDDYRAANGALVLTSREEVIVDTGRIRNEIERLTLEFPHYVPALMASAELAYVFAEPAKAQGVWRLMNRPSKGTANE